MYVILCLFVCLFPSLLYYKKVVYVALYSKFMHSPFYTLYCARGELCVVKVFCYSYAIRMFCWQWTCNTMYMPSVLKLEKSWLFSCWLLTQFSIVTVRGLQWCQSLIAICGFLFHCFSKTMEVNNQSSNTLFLEQKITSTMFIHVMRAWMKQTNKLEVTDIGYLLTNQVSK